MNPLKNDRQYQYQRAAIEVSDPMFCARQIRKYRTQKKFNQGELSEKLGIHKNTVTNWEGGRRHPDFEMIPRLCEALGITMEELYGIEPEYSETTIELAKKIEKLSDAERKVISRTVDSLLEDRYETWVEEVRDKYIRVYKSGTKAAGGLFNPLDGYSRGNYVYITKDVGAEEDDEIITVTGDSMEPTYYEGDDLLVRCTPSLRPGDIGVFVINGEGFVKEYQRDGLHSHNSAYETIHVGEGDSFRCFGKVIGKIDQEDYASREELEVLMN